MTHEHVNSRFYVCMYVCMYAYICLCIYVCMHLCMKDVCTMYMTVSMHYLFMHVCMYVCMYASGSEIKVTRVVVASNGNHCFDNFLAFASQVLKPNCA